MATGITTDEKLLSNIRGGNHHAFTVLVKRYTTQYYNLAYRYVVNQQEAEDIVQTAFLKLWEKPKAWNPKKDSKFTTWFYRVIVNLCLDRLKKHKTAHLPENFDIEDKIDTQENVLLKQEKEQQLANTVSTLPKRQKTAVILCFYQELSRKEAAQIMNINIKALESLLMRAKTTLKSNMIKKEDQI